MSFNVTDDLKKDIVGLSTLILNAPPGSSYLAVMSQYMAGGVTLSSIAETMFKQLMGSPDMRGASPIDALNLIISNLGLEKGSYGQKYTLNYLMNGLAKGHEIGGLLVDVMRAIKDSSDHDFWKASLTFQNKIAVGYSHTLSQKLYSSDITSLKTAYYGITEDAQTAKDAIERLSHWKNDGGSLGISNKGISFGGDGETARGYKLGDEVSVEVTFDAPVIVKGNPTLLLNVGGETKIATYDSGSGGKKLIFKWVVDAGSNDANGISFDANGFSLNGGSIKNAMGGKPSLEFATIKDNPLNIVDTAIPDSVDLNAKSGVQGSATIAYTSASFAQGVSLIPNLQVPTATDIATVKIKLAGSGLDAGAGHDQLVLGDKRIGLDVDSSGKDLTVGGVSGIKYSYTAETHTLSISLPKGAVIAPNLLPKIVSAIKFIATSGVTLERTAEVTLLDLAGNAGSSAIETLKFDESVSKNIDFSSAAGIQSSANAAYSSDAWATGVKLLPGLQSPSSPDIAKMVITLGGQGLDIQAGRDQLILDSVIDLNADATGKDVVVAGINHIYYTWSASTRTLVIGHGDGTALTEAEITKLASGLKLMTESTNHANRVVSVAYVDLGGSMSASGAATLGFSDSATTASTSSSSTATKVMTINGDSDGFDVTAQGDLTLTSSHSGTAELTNLSSGAVVGPAVSLSANTPESLSFGVQATVTYLQAVFSDGTGNRSTLPDTLVLGTAGNDTISGTSGSDVIYGFSGDNTLIGGRGADTIVSGSGSDTFSYTSLADSLAGNTSGTSGDTVFNFKHLEDHFKVDSAHASAINSSGGFLSGSGFSAGSSGNLGLDIGLALNHGGASMAANGAAVVTITGNSSEAGTYLVINDNQSGFSADTDAVIKIVGTSDIPSASDFIV